MLAQNFKTPAKLRITDAEFEALTRVLGMLERGELVDATCQTRSGEPDIIPNGFCMHWSGTQTDCGTVGCIGGWVAVLMGVNMNDYVNTKFSPNLRELYWFSAAYNKATVATAAIAVRNYLTHGEPRWAEALSG